MTEKCDGIEFPQHRRTGGSAASIADLFVDISLSAMEIHDAGTTVLMGLAAYSVTESVRPAVALLRREFAMSGRRAEKAVRLGMTLGRVTGRREPLGVLAGMTVGERNRGALALMFGDVGTADDGADASILSLGAVLAAVTSHRVERVAIAAARSEDYPSLLAAAALTAAFRSRSDFLESLDAGVLRSTLARAQSRRTLLRNRVLMAAYALAASDRSGLFPGNSTSQFAPASWRAAAAPWVLSVFDPDARAGLDRLLIAARARGLNFVPPGEMPFRCPGTPSDVDEARALASSMSPDLKKLPNRPTWFDGDPQILLLEHETTAYAWVGRSRRGVLVSFDTVHFQPYLIDEPGVPYAVAAAIGWYLDVSVVLRAKPNGSRTIDLVTGAPGDRMAGRSFRPNISWHQQRREVMGGGRTPPDPHWVSPHLRRLSPGRRPNPDHVAEAPRRLRKLMSPRDTWVRGYPTGTGTMINLPVYLSEHSALADILGKMER